MHTSGAIAWLFTLFVLIAGCEEPRQGRDANGVQDAATVRDSAGVRIVENSAATWAVPWRVAEQPSLTIGSVEGDPDHELDQVTGAVRFADGTIAVANAGRFQILFYNSAGDLTARAGGRGGGPGEFQNLEWIARFGADTLLALDVRSHRVSYFDSRGRLGRSVRMEPDARISLPRPVGFFADGSLLATHGMYALGGDPPIRVIRDSEPLFRYDTDGRTATLAGSFPGRERIIVPTAPAGGRLERRARPFGRETVFATSGNRFYVADNASYEIRVYSPDGRLVEIIRKEHAPLALADADITTFQDSVLADANESRRRQMRVLFERQPQPPETLPAYAPDIHIDSEGNLWILGSTLPGDRRSRWSVFSAEGRFLGMLDLSPGLKVLDIGSDYILGLRRNELDVEFVELYELRRGG